MDRQHTDKSSFMPSIYYCTLSYDHSCEDTLIDDVDSLSATFLRALRFISSILVFHDPHTRTLGIFWASCSCKMPFGRIFRPDSSRSHCLVLPNSFLAQMINLKQFAFLVFVPPPVLE